jgi:hypothetical protein
MNFNHSMKFAKTCTDVLKEIHLLGDNISCRWSNHYKTLQMFFSQDRSITNGQELTLQNLVDVGTPAAQVNVD